MIQSGAWLEGETHDFKNTKQSSTRGHHLNEMVTFSTELVKFRSSWRDASRQ